MTAGASFTIAGAQPADVPQLLALIRGLAEFERLTHLVECTEARLDAALFGPQPAVEALLAWEREARDTAACDRPGPGESRRDDPAAPLGFALFFHNYSTFLGRRGLYLEDLYVRPEHRGRGCGRALLRALARIALERDCGRFEWSVLDWNVQAQGFYRALGASVLPDWRIVRLTGEGIAQLAGRHEAGSE